MSKCAKVESLIDQCSFASMRMLTSHGPGERLTKTMLAINFVLSIVIARESRRGTVKIETNERLRMERLRSVFALLCF